MNNEDMNIEDMNTNTNNSKQKLYERLEKNRERFRSHNLTKRGKKRRGNTASTRKRNLKHSYLMSRRSQMSKKQRKSSRTKKDIIKFDPVKENQRQKQLQMNMKEDEAKKAASKLVESLGYSGKNVPVKILNTELFNKALSRAVEDELLGASKPAYDPDELDYYISSDSSSSSRKGKGKGKKSKRRS